jgi:Zn-dependent peptidase ImmA (M78 family)
VRKPDDSSLSHHEYNRVRQEAERMLMEADALGRLPTPVTDIMAAAKITVDPENVLDASFLERMHLKASSVLKRALSKVRGLFDAHERLVFIDQSVHKSKQTFLKLHETGHAVLPWQRNIYAVVEDCDETLSPDIADLFDREANVFATEVLFQLDGFINEAANHPFEIKTPLKLCSRYGSSVYAALRQYVSKNNRACMVLVLNPPELIEGDGFRASLRRVVASRPFLEIFGELPWPPHFTPDDDIGAIIPAEGKKMSWPREIVLVDRNGDRQECLAEAFRHSYNIFILIHVVQTLNRTIIIQS